MKTNILVNNTNMKQYIKYLCAVVLMLGMNISAWGAVIDKTNYTISTDDIDFGNLDASTPAYVAAGVIETYQEVTITLKKNVNTFVYFVASPDDYYITGYSDASTYFVGNTTGSYTIRVYTYFELDNSTHTHTLYFFMGAESEEISVTATVINACTPNDIAYDHSGTGGNDPTGDATACEDATVSFTPDPSTGYEYSGATVYLSDMETVHASLNSSTTSFTMPNEDVYVVATYAPIDYTISFNANGGSSTMESVERAYNSTYELPACTFTAPAGKVFKCWAEGSAGGTERAVGYSHTVAGDITFYAKWRDGSYTDYVFSCAELTLTPKLVTASTPIFITSAASKTVRSQDSILIVGSGLTPNQELEFPGLPSQFEIKTRTNGTLAVDADGSINAVAYIFYTPDAGATDILNKITGVTVKVDGAKPIQKTLTHDIIGRRLPSEFVIAVKRNNKWYALPDTMTVLGTPKPIEIAVDDINNPSIAYTSAATKFSLEGPASGNLSGGVGQYVKLVMTSLWSDDSDHSKGHAPLFGSATKTAKIGKSGNSQATNPLSKGWWWQLIQKNTSITNPQDAKYQIYCANNDTTLSLKENAGNPIWGLYKSGIDELRLIPASDIVFAEASVVEWGQHAAIIEVDATAATGIDATSVIAHLNGENSAAIDLVQTKAGDAKNNSSKYNYTVNFGDGIDLAAAASNGAMLTLEWKNGATVKAMSNIVVPKIVASTKVIVNSTNYPTKSVWDTEVHVLPGDTLEIDASGYDKKVVTISELNIYPGATVKIVGTNDSLNVRSLVLRNGWTRVGSKRYDVARLYVGSTSYLKKANNKDGWYSDWYIDYDQYYPIAVPFPVATSSICYKNTTSSATGGVTIRYYDGALRAANEQENQDDNWVAYTWGGTMPVNLEPSKGYVMTAKRPSGKAFSIVRLPMTFSNPWTALGEKGSVGETHKDTVVVTAYGKDVVPAKPTYVVGWNMIANPYMALHQGELTYDDASGDVIEYANVPDINFKEYDQVPIETTKLKPSSGFLVQAPKTGTVTFDATNRKASAPSYRQEPQSPKASKQKAYIVLSNDEANDMMGLLISDSYTAEYELNADLEKILSDGNTLRTYMRYNDMNMAYVAINSILAEEWIPVSVRFPETGEYTFSMHEASKVDELEYVYLIDYDSGDLITNLLDQSYTFYNSKGTFDYRFAINAKVGKRDVPTDIDVTDAEKNNGNAVKFLYRDKLYIMRSGRIYDATGKQVKGGAQ